MQTKIEPKQATEVAETRRVHFTTPAVNLHQEQDGFLLEADLPGVDKSGVDLRMEDGKLIITGHRKAEPNNGRVLHQEIAGVDYRRVFDLDPSIDPESIAATMEQGVLRIQLKKSEAHRPRKIQVA